MFKSENCKCSAYVNLPIEALWLARAVQDALNVPLGEPIEDAGFDRDRTKVLGISRDVFERLGTYGHRNEHVQSHNNEWTAASSTEFIRQVAVHWRAFIDASFGMTCACELILSLTDYEISVLTQVLHIDKRIRTSKDGVVFCMSQEMEARSQHQTILTAF